VFDRRSFGLLRLIVTVLTLFLVVVPGAAQEARATPVEVTAFRPVIVHTGPGDTYPEIDVLGAGVPVFVMERNRVGTWLRIEQIDDDGDVVLDGWIVRGYLNASPMLLFSEVPVNETLPDAQTEGVRPETVRRLYAEPVIPEISEAMHAVYELGLALGNRSNVVTKVGDSLTADPLYLNPMSRGDHVLGPYDYLEDTISFFGASVAELSVAARVGMASYVAFDPMWADPYICDLGETPLECEFRLKQPSIALIMFGGNDVRHTNVEGYTHNMRDIIELCLERGIIPVLSTFVFLPDASLGDRSAAFNLALIDLAHEYEIPLINLWSAAQVIPGLGLEGDGVHMTHSGFRYLKFDTGHEAWYGVPLRNLLTLVMLDELRRTLNMEVPTDETAELSTPDPAATDDGLHD
jgi:hypothetical protein